MTDPTAGDVIIKYRILILAAVGFISSTAVSHYRIGQLEDEHIRDQIILERIGKIEVLLQVIRNDQRIVQTTLTEMRTSK